MSRDPVFRVRFWGTRGSLPVSLNAEAVRGKICDALRQLQGRALKTESEVDRFVDTLDFSIAGTYGGQSACVELKGAPDEYFVCDMGSGLRAFGHEQIRHCGGAPQTYNIFASHLHWDHIMGFPFFTPAYVDGNRIRIHGCHDELEQALRAQQSPPGFPVSFDILRADIRFVQLHPGVTTNIDGVNVTPYKQLHEGDSYGYRFEMEGKAVVYSTDAEHKVGRVDEMRRTVTFFRDADLVIFDAMYSLAEAVSIREDWGHSSNVVAIELCHRANAKQLCLFHHEPVYGDAEIQRILEESIRYEQLNRVDSPLEVTAAYDGLEIAVS